MLVAFLTVGLFGLFHFTMNINNGGHTMGCPVTDMATICTMNPFTHIAMWQNMFTSSFPKEIFSLFALALLVIFSIFTLRNFWRDNKMSQVFKYMERFIILTSIVSDSLQEAFSNGILHPKRYNSPIYC